jgi:hypothetical protein
MVNHCLLYRDDNHLGIEGAKLLVHGLFAKLIQLSEEKKQTALK